MDKPIITAIDWTGITTAYGRNVQETEVKLTTQQAKMALEYFGAQAAEDAPADTVMGDAEWDTHAWQTRYAASLAIERQITEHDWHVLMTASMDLQSFDRDPAAYMYERGEADWGSAIDRMRDTLQDLVSWAIDLAYNNSGA